MTYFGIDILPIKINGKSELRIGEIGGIDTGRSGFVRIYGDHRVDDTVKKMIEERYGTVVYNSGLLNKALYNLSKKNSEQPEELLSAGKDVVYDHLEKEYPEEFTKDITFVQSKDNPFGNELYLGQKGQVVANCFNPPSVVPVINPYFTQLAARDKAIQLSILHNFKHTIDFIPGDCYGAKDADIGMITRESDKVILKKFRGSCGQGIEIITSKELIGRSKGWARRSDELHMDAIKDPDKEFWIMQPFYDTTEKTGTYYISIRSVICNGEFVDAYARYSKDPVVNISRGALSVALTDHTKLAIAEMSEHTVKEFLRITGDVEKSAKRRENARKNRQKLSI